MLISVNYRNYVKLCFLKIRDYDIRKNHSTQNQKLHRTVPLDFFQKKSTFPLCFNFTNSK